MGCNNILLLYALEVNRTETGAFHTRVGIANSFGILRLSSPIPVQGDLCVTSVYLLEEAIFSVIPVKLAPYSDTGTGI